MGVVSRAASPLFLGWVAFCSAVCVGIATGWTRGDPLYVRIAYALLALAVALVIALTPLLFLSRERSAQPEPVEAPSPPAEAGGAPPPAVDVRAELEAARAAGLELRDAPPDERVQAWIATTQRLLDTELPGAGRYFGALAASAWPAQLGRLETILRDFV
jgi:hypothetical protein